MNKQKKKTSNIVLVCLAVFLLIFISIMVVTYWVKGGIPDTLVQCVLGAGGVETVALAGIKVSKIINNKNGKMEELEDELE